MAGHKTLSFSKQQRKSLKATLGSLPAYQNNGNPESFLLCYIAFETVTRKIWNYYRSAKSNKTVNDTHAPLSLPAVKKSFSAYNIKVSDIVVSAILSSNLKKRGSMSARNLRNGLVHQWKEKDKQEVITRFDEMMNYLEKVIQEIKDKVE